MYKMLKYRAVALGKAERVNELYAGVITKQLRHREEQNKGTRAQSVWLREQFSWTIQMEKRFFLSDKAEILGFSL